MGSGERPRVVRVVVDSRVRVPSCLSSKLVVELQRAFEHKNPKYQSLRAMGYKPEASGERREIATWREEPGHYSFPRGGMGRVRALLLEHGFTLHVEDKRTLGVEGWGAGFEWPEHKLTLWPDQEEVVDVCKRKQNCVVRSATGSGKTSALLALAARLKLPTCIVVWTGPLFDQWLERVQSELGMDRRWVGQVRGSKRVYGPVTVAMQQTVALMPEQSDFFRRWGFMGFDECCVASAPILMADGRLRAIESVEVGDEVAIGGRVCAVMCRPYEGKLYRVGDAYLTAGHPVATQEGWVTSSTISSSHLLWYDPQHEEREDLRGMRGEDEGRLQEERVLKAHPLPGFRRRGEMQAVWGEGGSEEAGLSRDEPMRSPGALEQRADGRDARGDTSVHGGGAGSETPLVGREDSKSVATTRCERALSKGDLEGPEETVRVGGGAREESSSGAEVDRRREDVGFRGQDSRERGRANPVGAQDAFEVEDARVRIEPRRRDWISKGSGPGSLQDRFGAPREEDSGGARREQSSEPDPEESGRAQRLSPSVDGVACVPLPGAVRLRQGSVRVQECAPEVKGTVWNLETERGVYVVGGVLVHNCHRAAARTVFQAVDPFHAKYRVGVSDDERRKDRKDFLIHDLFGEVAVEVTREELVEKGRILDVAMRIVPTGWRPASASPEADELLGRPDVDRSDYNPLLEEMMGSEERNEVAIDAAARYAGEGHQVLLFSLRREHCMVLNQRLVGSGVRSGLLIGGDDYRVSFRQTLEGLRSGDLRVGVGTVAAIGTGIDLPAVSRGVVAMPVAANRGLLRQVSGRICRAARGKDAEITYLFDEGVFPDHLGKLSKASNSPMVWSAEGWVTPRSWRAMRRRAG